METAVHNVSLTEKEEVTARDTSPQHFEHELPQEEKNLVYDNDDEEPEIHARTWLAASAMFLLNLVLCVGLQGPPAVLSYIGQDLNNTKLQVWLPQAYVLPQAILGPVICNISDKFQARKTLLLALCASALIGCGIAPGSQSMNRLIAAQVLIGLGFCSMPLGYAIPAEILPRKWRPLVQGVMNWLQFAIWGVTAVGIAFVYRPSKRHSQFAHLTIWQKLALLDLPGVALLTIGLTLFMVGLNLGGNLYAWTNARVISTLVIGAVGLIAFGLFEWKGTKHGILDHALFQGPQGRNFAICMVLIAVEGLTFFSFVIFNPVLSQTVFTPANAFLLTARSTPFFVALGIATFLWGFWSTRFRTIRIPLFTSFVLYTAFLVAFATVQPGDNVNQIVFAAGLGVGFGGPLIILIAATQLSVPHSAIALATAAIVSARALAASAFTAIYVAAFNTRIAANLPAYIAKAAVQAGLSAEAIPAFVQAMAAGNSTAIEAVPGVTTALINQGSAAVKSAYADSIRIVYIIAAPIALVACVMVYFLGDLKKMMDYHVDAPVEVLQAKSGHSAPQVPA